MAKKRSRKNRKSSSSSKQLILPASAKRRMKLQKLRDPMYPINSNSFQDYDYYHYEGMGLYGNPPPPPPQADSRVLSRRSHLQDFQEKEDFSFISSDHHFGGGEKKCCPLVVDPLTVVTLLVFIAAAAAFLNVAITMDIGRKRRRRRSKTSIGDGGEIFAEILQEGRNRNFLRNCNVQDCTFAAKKS